MANGAILANFSTARNKHVICKRERLLAEVSEARVIHHVSYLHLAR